MVPPSRWKTRHAKLSRAAFALMLALPAALLLQAAAIYFGPLSYETRVLFDLEHPERNGDLISSSTSTLVMILTATVLLTALGFVVGLVLLIVSLYRSPSHATTTI